MEQRLRVRHVGALLAVLGALSLSGCASPTAIEDFSGLPQVPVAQAAGAEEEAGAELEELEVDEGETVVVYLDYGDRLALVTWGSSTCPVVGSDIVVVEDADSGNSVRIETFMKEVSTTRTNIAIASRMARRRSSAGAGPGGGVVISAA